MTSPTVTDLEFSLLKTLIEKESGIFITEKKKYLINTKLSSLLTKTGCTSFIEFYNKALEDMSLKADLIDAITTNETSWFRDSVPFETLETQLLPECLAAIFVNKNDGIRIWSCACSTGQETYSIAMTVNEFVHNQKCNWLLPKIKVLGTDLAKSVLKEAESGSYSKAFCSRGLSEEMRAKYFEPEEGSDQIKVNTKIKSMVSFQTQNLRDSFDSLGTFDIIFLRNVLIYFTDDFKKEIYNKVYKALNPGGFFIMGSSEFLPDEQKGFKLNQYKKGFYYQRE